MSSNEDDVVKKSRFLSFFQSEQDSDDSSREPSYVELKEIKPDKDSEKDKFDSENIQFKVDIDPRTLPDFANPRKMIMPPELTPEEKMKRLEEYFKHINDDIENVVNAIGQSRSLLTKWATAWGETSSFTKATVGITSGILVIGLGTVGIMLHIMAIPIALGAVSTFAVSTTMLFQDHYDAQQTFLNEIKKGYTSLASILQMTVLALEEIRQGFAEELQKFKTQNIKLEQNVREFESKISSLTGQVIGLEKTRELLDQEISNLKIQIGSLEETSLEYKQSTKLLEELTERQEEINKELGVDLLRLKEANQELKENQEQSAEMVNTLNQTITALTSTKVKDEKQREQFLGDLTRMISSRDERLKQLTKGFTETDDQLKGTTKELEDMKARYSLLNDNYQGLLKQHDALLARHEKQIERLERIQSMQDRTQELRFGLSQHPKAVEKSEYQKPKLVTVTI
jgi:DNA repair exonuclease SbcCD ATPase subunit